MGAAWGCKNKGFHSADSVPWYSQKQERLSEDRRAGRGRILPEKKGDIPRFLAAERGADKGTWQKRGMSPFWQR
jgi:hypothetical protein